MRLTKVYIKQISVSELISVSDQQDRNFKKLLNVINGLTTFNIPLPLHTLLPPRSPSPLPRSPSPGRPDPPEPR